MSTFHGLEMAKRALSAQQGGLYTTGHNISNVNTEGYSRQRVNFETGSPFPVPSRVQPKIAGQIGTGVNIGVVDRIRNKFLDMQFRTENSRLGYWETRQEALSRMEELMNEPSDTGLSKTMDKFWQALQDLADHPENDGARSVVAERGLAMAETFNHLSKSLESIQSDLKEQIDQSETDVNSLLEKINELNRQIGKIEPHGMLANDLYDERDRLIDQLSEFVNVKVHRTESSSSALANADGLVSIELVDASGKSIGTDGTYLIDMSNGIDDAVQEISISPGKNEDGPITGFTIGGENVDIDTFLSAPGSIGALVEAYGYSEDGDPDGAVIGDYPEMLAELNKMAQQFANAFNDQHISGVDANGNEGTAFFEAKDGGDITAGNITVREDILKNSDLIAASDSDKGSKNGENALNLAALFDENVIDDTTSIRKYYTAIIGDIGVEGEKADRMVKNTQTLQNQINNSRMSTSAVSLDEEITNLIKFQHAYNAAARNMTAIDELIDRVINQMGLVGR